MHEQRRWQGLLLAAAVFAVALGTPTTGQAQTQQGSWEVEGYGGLMIPTGGSSEGAATLPLPGPPIATSSPFFPSRSVPSWFFGDGAQLLNQVNGQFGVASLIEPLDAALGGSTLSAGSGFAAGARVRRSLTQRFALEFSLDLVPSAVDFSDEFLAAAEVTRASFAPAFQGLLGTGPFTDVSIDSAGELGGSSLEVGFTGALVWHLGPTSGFQPYLTFGGGVISGAGEGRTYTLQGRYQFRVAGEVPIDETDRLTLRLQNRTVFAGVAGAGLKREVGNNWGIRIDGRVLIAPHTTSLLIDTDPLIAQGTPPDFVESLTTPSIQFSNSGTTGRESSLGAQLQGFEAFVEDGLQFRVLVSAGVYFRF